MGGSSKEMAMFAALVTFWALNYPLVKLALEYTGPVDLMLFRLAFALPFLAVIMPRSFAPLKGLRANAELAAFGALDIALTWLLWYEGEYYVSSSLAVLIMYTYPIIVVLLGAALLRERLTWKKLAGIGMGFAGLLVIFSNGMEVYSWKGPVLILMSAITWSFGVVFYKARLSSYPAGTVNTYQLIYALPFALAAALASGQLSLRLSVSFIIIMIIMAFPGTAVAFYVYVVLYSKNEVGRVTPYLFLVPAISVLFSYAIFGSGLGRPDLLGFALLSTGIAVSAKG